VEFYRFATLCYFCLIIMENTEQYLAINLNLDVDFLRFVHTHKALSQVFKNQGDWHEYILNSKSGEIKIQFAGCPTNRFLTSNAFQSYMNAFIDLLNRYIKPDCISTKVINELLYIITVCDDEVFQIDNSARNNKENDLKALAKLWIDLSNIEVTDLKPESERIYYIDNQPYLVTNDIRTKRKKNGYTYDAYDCIKIRVNEKLNLLFPKDLNISLTKPGAKLDSKGRSVNLVTIPPQLNEPIVRLITEYILNQHKEAQTDFYKAIEEGKVDDEYLDTFVVARNVYSVSLPYALFRISQILISYLNSNGLLIDSNVLHKFLFEYFAINKVWKPERREQGLRETKIIMLPFPEKYEDLVAFYTDEVGIDEKHIYILLRDIQKRINYVD